ncbi:Flagellar biosynthesis protein, FliO [Bosea sp. 62]|uniref:flagellar biosynthetic protein FliO n=1 Tax=unclassified Bosea (in: a-proteobacteria) TaxID=2653178 RepID=UPI0012566FCA|nr:MULTISPECIES: flagellar biosynthetic protein FliO [unclassified Bosea (in: a-proteobacteria)]CAD5267452.1 Flagellar biosynthesis protein, FliO [Bosea sp. 46]CAD5269304.1 Flagellar biosynthesis protein, FliO [Bosea sp. 7B]CAD5269310.1 Flagellar biosynthesis protein, FliO [Bosea sp. 21B]VVT62508.1 Flagellar biosynthesis protein, FliO [Bosea sp. EC-HK365B]VXB95773.1 Flagellar biosynthesis protein, FliO [Bosea sp. 29B]
MQTLFGFELSSGLRWIIAFAVVLLLVALLGFFLRRMSGGRLKFKGQGGGRTRQPRLGVVDVYDLDRQRQLILVRRDNVEHLVMIGGASDVVVETNIVRSGGRVAAPLPSEGLAERPLAFEPESRPQPVEDTRPTPPLPVPAPAVPVDAVPPPRPVSPPPAPPRAVVQPSIQPQPPRPAQAPTSIPPVVAAGAAGISATLARDPAPAASASELGDMARQLEEALKRPFSAVRPGSAGPRPEPEAPQASKPAVPPAPPVLQAPVKPPAPTPEPARPALDMEAELEMALGLKPGPARPAAAEAPLVAPPVFAPPKPPAPAPMKLDEKKPEPAKEQALPVPASEPEKPAKFAPVFDDVLDAVENAAKAEAPAKNEPKPNEQKPAEGKPVEVKPAESKSTETKPTETKPADAKPADTKPAEAKPADEPKPAAKASEDDPFSVDAIEAEFARLLGRDPKPKG